MKEKKCCKHLGCSMLNIEVETEAENCLGCGKNLTKKSDLFKNLFPFDDLFGGKK